MDDLREDTHEVTTPDGSEILVQELAHGPVWVGAPGLYGPDELRDIADALDQFEPEDDEEE